MSDAYTKLFEHAELARECDSVARKAEDMEWWQNLADEIRHTQWQAYERATWGRGNNS